MGAINDVFSQNKLSFSKIGEILNNLITPEGGIKTQNRQILQEIGLLNEYSYIISDKASNEIIYYSKNNKILKNIIFTSDLRLNFLEWAKYFFDISNEDLNSIQQFNKKTESFKTKTLTKEFFQNNLKKYIFNNKSFKKLLNYGIPKNFRFFIWDIILSEKYNNHNYFNYEQELKQYQSILQNKETSPQIEKDLHRTFMDDAQQTQKNIQILRNILNCINKYNSSGYCQGMNFIVGYLLKLTNYDEVKAFYIFKSVLCDIKGYFEVGFPLLKKNNELFNKLFKESYPKLYKHFEKHDIVNEFWVGKWFQTLFTLSVPFEELNVIWDVLLIKGFDFSVYISLALIESIEKDLLEINDSVDIVNFFEKVLNSTSTQNGLIPVNKKYFEGIDNYIISLNEVLAQADEIQKKYLAEKDNKPFYDRRKSDGYLPNFKFNSLKTEKLLNDDNNCNSNNSNSDKKMQISPISSSPSSESSTTIANNSQNQNNSRKIDIHKSVIQNQNYILPNNINNNINNKINLTKSINNTNLNLDNRKMPFYSTKNLGIYNFGDIQNDNKIGNVQVNYNIQQNNNFNGLNIIPGQFQYLKHSSLNINNIPNSSNYLKYYP